MILKSSPSKLKGRVKIPGSKSHSIRGVFLGTLANGITVLHGRLKSADVDSAITACRAMGALIVEEGEKLTIKGVGGKVRPDGDLIDVGNSGTTAAFLLSMAALSGKTVTVTGDESTNSRPMAPLLEALANLGVTVEESNNGRLPVRLHGPMKGGRTGVLGTSSQYLSSLLLHAPFCEKETAITVEKLNEKPYVDMTVEWLRKLGVVCLRDGYREFVVPPGQRLKGFETSIPADFSSAAFFLVLSAIEGCEVELEGLDMEDTQGDKEVVNFLKSMGADIECGKTIRIRGRALQGRSIDLNDTPDALPAMAVAGCLADGVTHLANVPQARIKETDRIAVMARELKKMGADISEEEDGLLIRKSRLIGAKVDGHGDHRVVMSLAVAGLSAEGETEISTADAVNVTFPDFVELMRSCGANMKISR